MPQSNKYGLFSFFQKFEFIVLADPQTMYQNLGSNSRLIHQDLQYLFNNPSFIFLETSLQWKIVTCYQYIKTRDKAPHNDCLGSRKILTSLGK